MIKAAAALWCWPACMAGVAGRRLAAGATSAPPWPLSGDLYAGETTGTAMPMKDAATPILHPYSIQYESRAR